MFELSGLEFLEQPDEALGAQHAGAALEAVCEAPNLDSVIDGVKLTELLTLARTLGNEGLDQIGDIIVAQSGAKVADERRIEMIRVWDFCLNGPGDDRGVMGDGMSVDCSQKVINVERLGHLGGSATVCEAVDLTGRLACRR